MERIPLKMALHGTVAKLVALVSMQSLLLMLLPAATARRVPLLLVCNMLPIEECAFAVDSAGHRCVLETLSGGIDWHVCQTSDIMVNKETPKEHIETEQCVKACGVAKMTVGLSTDTLDSSDFTSKLCSSDCLQNCPNLVDLYTNLVAGEGKSLKLMCANLQHPNQHLTWERPVHRRQQLEVATNDVLDVADEPSPAPSSGL